MGAPSSAQRAAIVRELGQSGLGLIQFWYVVEVRSAAQQIAGIWCDVWVADGAPHARSIDANEAALALRDHGFTVRVRPVLA